MSVEAATPISGADSGEENIKSREQIRLEIVSKLAELGVAECPEEIIERLVLISENSEFNSDSEMICEAFENVLSVLEVKNQTKQLSPKQKQDGLLAAFLHDIGKSGPLSADLVRQLCIIKLFSLKNLNPKQSVGETVRIHFPDDYEQITEGLLMMGIREDSTMRNFWDKHVWWTHDILSKYPEVIGDKVNLIASSHHINVGINPCMVPEDEIPYESEVIGALENYIDFLEERILMVVDKYQAVLVRGQVSHDGAMDYLKTTFQMHKKDTLINLIMEVVDELGRRDALFPNTKGKYQKKIS